MIMEHVTELKFNENYVSAGIVAQDLIGDASKYNGIYSKTYVIEKTKGMSSGDALELLEKNGVPLKGTHCTHEYDCCGRYYASPVKLMAEDTYVYIFIQYWNQNV